MTNTIASMRRKITSAGDLQSVVRTMKAMAAANIGQYETAERALGDYYHNVELGLGKCLRELGHGMASVDWSCPDRSGADRGGGFRLRSGAGRAVQR